MTAPTLYLTNVASVAAVDRGNAAEATRAAVGQGPVLSIMRHPPPYMAQRLAGQVLALTPTAAALEAALRGLKGWWDDGGITWKEYADRLHALWRAPLEPGRLLVWDWHLDVAPGDTRWDGDLWRRGDPVPDGATLVCACAKGELCHRHLAAPLLAAAGWSVVLDGVPFVDDPPGIAAALEADRAVKSGAITESGWYDASNGERVHVCVRSRASRGRRAK